MESPGAEVTDSGQPIPSLLADEFGLPFILSFLDGFGRLQDTLEHK